MDPLRQLRLAALAVLALLALGMLGFRLIEDLSLIDSFYMTAITLTTLGTEVVKPLSSSGKAFISILSLSSIFIIFTVVFSAIINAIEAAASDKMRNLFWRRRMDKAIKGMKNHYILCGYGRMGQAIAAEFSARKVDYVVIENNPEQISRLIEQKVLFVEGDASDEEALHIAGVERAKGLISVAPSDPENTFIVLTAKGINPNLFVVARSIKTQDEPKLRRAGADRVMSPYILGGKRMAWAVLRPTVVDFLESAVYSESLELEISEVTVSPDSPFSAKTLRESGIREKSGATVIAIKSKKGALTSSPSPDIQIQEGDVLVAVGTPRQLEALGGMADP